MKKVVGLIVVPFLVAGCGGGGSGSQVFNDPADVLDPDEYNPEGPVVNACDAVFFQEVAGEYEGAVYYSNPPVSCEWSSVRLQVFTAYDPFDSTKSFCELSYSVTSDTALLADRCSDVAAEGEYLSLFGIEDEAGGWENPPWPISGVASVGGELTDGLVYPVGGGHVDSFQITFDGADNAYFSNDVLWSSVLVKTPEE